MWMWEARKLVHLPYWSEPDTCLLLANVPFSLRGEAGEAFSEFCVRSEILFA